MRQYKRVRTGQALITVIFVTVIGMIIVTGAMMTLLSNLEGTTGQEMDNMTVAAAESGAENGLVKLLRDPSYSGEVMQMDSDRTVTITVSSASGVLITSRATMGSVSKNVTITAHYANLNLVVDSWKEMP